MQLPGTNATIANDNKDNQFNKTLLETKVPCKLKSNDREDYNIVLNLSIKTIQKKNNSQSIINLQITDDSNLYFLQILNLSEQEFL